MRRVVRSELLDHLPASNPQAARARVDLRRINRILRHPGIIDRAYASHFAVEAARRRPLRLCDLGAGDGWLMLQLARLWADRGVRANAELIDLHYLLSEATRRELISLNWTVTLVAMDVSMWLNHRMAERADLTISNLFLHHFSDSDLRSMFRKIAPRTECFIACEPRRNKTALAVAQALWLTGCNPVTRHDAPLSVQGGFEGRELSELWPERERWLITEGPAGWFTHCFVARRVREP
ncbi:MAG: methyltransferase domain-containing protein [Chthoniobacteraceae bacterium]